MPNIRTSINIPERILEKIDEIAIKNDRSRSKEILRALQEYVDRAEGNIKDPVIIPDDVLRELIREEIKKEKDALIEKHKK